MFAAILATPRTMLKTESHISWLCKPLANSSKQYTLALNVARVILIWPAMYLKCLMQAFNFFSVLSLFWVNNIAIIIKFVVQRDKYYCSIVC